RCVATRKLNVLNEVSPPDEARAAVRRPAEMKSPQVKLWYDDRRGSYPKLTPETMEAIIDEAHKRRMIVNAHATTLPDQKAVVRAGADVLVHMVQGEKIDDELMAILREKKPYWATVIGLGDRPGVCDNDPFFEEALPASVVATIRATKEARALSANCAPPGPNAPRREEIMAYNFPRMIQSGV